jgi:hypothetical protein
MNRLKIVVALLPTQKTAKKTGVANLILKRNEAMKIKRVPMEIAFITSVASFNRVENRLE